MDHEPLAWRPISEAPKDGTYIACCWAGQPNRGWCALCWKVNRRIDREYFGDPDEDDDYELPDDQPTHFIAMPPVPAA
jgi:hypothetical protein